MARTYNLDFTIRPANNSDIKPIAQIHLESWQQAYKNLMPQGYIDSYTIEKLIQLWTNIIERNLADVLVAQQQTELIGFICFGQTKKLKTTQTYEISSIYLKPEYWGMGIGKALYHECEKIVNEYNAEQISLWALHSNENALAFYKKLGFIPSGALHHEYTEDGILSDIKLVKPLRRKSI